MKSFCGVHYEYIMSLTTSLVILILLDTNMMNKTGCMAEKQNCVENRLSSKRCPSEPAYIHTKLSLNGMLQS